MAKYVWPTAEKQIDRHLGGALLTEEEKKALRQSLEPVAITEKERSFYSCCRQYGPVCQAQHREHGQCPICGKQVYNIYRRWIKKDERREQFHYFYSKSKTDKDTIIVRGVWVGEIWEDARNKAPDRVETRYDCHGLLVIPYGGKPVRYIREEGYGSANGWVRRSKPQGGMKTAWLSQQSAIYTLIHVEEQKKAIRGTRFEKMVRWAANHAEVGYDISMTNLLVGIAKHPQVEYLAARGLTQLTREYLSGYGTAAINWKEKTPERMLGLTRDELGRIKAKGLDVGNDTLMLLKMVRQYDTKAKLEDVMAARKGIPTYTFDYLREIMSKAGAQFGPMKVLRYAKTKIEGYNIRTWRDYMAELEKLDEVEDEARVFPKDLLAAHAETSARVRAKASAEQQEKLDALLPELRKKYSFRANNLVLEPFATLAEVIEEGAKQHICIGSYADRYANGGTVLCKLRRESAPAAPWHAVEFNKRGEMVQCRGERNTTAPEDEQAVRDFWAAWDAVHKTTTSVYLDIRARRTAA